MSLLGEPKVPVEFPEVVIIPVQLYECSICKALVRKPGVQPHADWHSGEQERNWSGF